LYPGIDTAFKNDINLPDRILTKATKLIKSLGDEIFEQRLRTLDARLETRIYKRDLIDERC
jgi:hypothetical protein